MLRGAGLALGISPEHIPFELGLMEVGAYLKKLGVPRAWVQLTPIPPSGVRSR